MKEKQNYKVTISFPIYNVENTIKESLLSALNQTYTNLEILAVDDCGTDRSLEIFDSVVKNHPRNNQVKLVHHQCNKGLGSVRNTSVEYASGDLIFFMDSDDILEINGIEVLVDLLVTNNVDFVTASYVEINEGKYIEHRYKNDQKISAGSILHTHYCDEPIFVYMWNKLIKIDLLRKKNIRCIHPYVEDDMFTFSLVTSDVSCYKSTAITYQYIIRNNSLTKSLMSERIPQKTAEIYVDIIKRKLLFAKTHSDTEISSIISIYILNSAFLRLLEIDRSNIIDYCSKLEVEKSLLNEVNKDNLFFPKGIMSLTHFIKYALILFATFLPFPLKRKYMLFIQKQKS